MLGQKSVLLMQVFQTENDIGIALCTLHLHVLFHHHKDLVDQKKMHEIQEKQGMHQIQRIWFRDRRITAGCARHTSPLFCINIQHY